MRAILGALALAGITPSPAIAAQTKGSGPCADTEHHQFDFWVGHWDVYNPRGKLVAHSLIEPVYGCGIRDNWMPHDNQPGGSLNIYAPPEKHSEQFWTASVGNGPTIAAC